MAAEKIFSSPKQNCHPLPAFGTEKPCPVTAIIAGCPVKEDLLLNRFPFMAAPAHLVQLLAQQGGGVAIPAGNINWDVPFPRALELARRTGAQVLARAATLAVSIAWSTTVSSRAPYSRPTAAFATC